MRVMLTIIAALAGLIPAALAAQVAADSAGRICRVAQDSEGIKVPYQLFVPPQYDKSQRYPEAWQRFLKRWMIANDSPIAKAYAGGDLSKVFDLVVELQKEFRVDADRIYVIGHSMGGVGTWNAIHARPELFAAAIPTAGGLSPWKDPKRFANVPIWAFHGSDDPTVPVEFTRMLFTAMVQCGGNMKYTEMKGVGHGVPAWVFHGDDQSKGYVTQYSGDRCDKEGDVWDWLFRQKRR